MPSYHELAERMQLPISFLYGDSKVLDSFPELMYMTIFYIATISILSYFMKDRRATENKILKLQMELKKLEKDAATNAAIKEKYEAKQKEYQNLKGSYKPFNINFITIPHNFIMCIYSLYAWIGVLCVMIENNKNAPIWTLWCDPNKLQKRGIDYWFYTFYLSKFVEYIDTIFLVIKAKGVMPPQNSQYFLHIYHHAVTACIVWLCLHYNFTVSWTGPFTNSFVHIFMYGYYGLMESNMIDRRIGGKFITPIQLIQFAFCLILAAIELVMNVTSGGGCGSNNYVILCMLFNYMVFFSFFVKVYTDKKRERTSAGSE
jgi:hypothetical protein